MLFITSGMSWITDIVDLYTANLFEKSDPKVLKSISSHQNGHHLVRRQ